LAASLGGRLAFSMLPLAFVLFATGQTRSAATAGALIAAFSATSVLAPARGRIVDRRGPPALIGFALGCSASLVALVVAGALDAPAGVLVIIGGLAGLLVPPLGPFTRATWRGALGERPDRLRRVFALDSAGEEATLVVAPLIVALAVALVTPSLALVIAAAGLFAGTTAAARSPLTACLRPEGDAPGGRARLPAALWLLIASLLGPGAALGAINLAVPALARADGAPARAGLLAAALAAGTAAASLAAGRGRASPPTWRPAALQAALAAVLAGAAAVAGVPLALGLVLAVAGAAVGALFMTLYLLVGELTPPDAGTRVFGWLVTANNAGVGLGAAVAGEVVRDHGGGAGMWLSAGCALLGLPIALALGVAGSRADMRRPSPKGAP
jgi:hypothetical protein